MGVFPALALRMTRLRFGGALVCLLGAGCEPPLVVGDLLQCSASQGGAAPRNANGTINDGPLPAPWQTSFDDGFCGFKHQAGFCYADPDSSYRLVTEPVHTGPFAAAFDMPPSDRGGARQTRCVREGAFPSEAYYGAWYYVPSSLSAAHTWNLFHFQGAVPGERLRDLWDVSMEDSNGVLTAFVLNMMTRDHYALTVPKPIPLDSWFHLEFYLKGAADATGEVALYQDGEELLRVAGIITNDTPFTQWYVGNFSGAIPPNSPTSSLYVDDVSVRLP